jgi:signal transduction histidine kinase
MNENKIHTIAEMQARYKTESKEKENILLRKNNEINKLIIKKNSNLNIFFIVLLILTIFLIILIYSRLMIKKKRNKELRENNNLINKQKNQLSVNLLELQKLNNILEQQKEEIVTTSKELKIANKQLTELNATKDKFFSIIAHDLRSPFNGILGFSELLIENVKEFETAESERYLEIINSSAKNTLVLLNNLLFWAKSQTGQINFNPKKIVLASIIQEIIKTSNSVAKIKDISLNYIKSDEIEAYADENMLLVILRNLISNAIKFTNPKGKINVYTLQNDNFIEIAVSDNGVGMNEETRKKLFDISTNITSPGTANEKGSGLGLILCKEFVEKHGGKIWIESEEGKGSIFYFTLPHHNETVKETVPKMKFCFPLKIPRLTS